MGLNKDTISRSSYSAVLWTLIIGITASIFWACFFKIDQTTRGVGTVIASSRIQIIQAVDGGVIQAMNVKEGDLVAKDEILAVFDQTQFSAAVKELDARLAALYAQQARLRAEITDAKNIRFPEKFSRFKELTAVQKALFKRRRQGIAQSLKNLESAVCLQRPKSIPTDGNGPCPHRRYGGCLSVHSKVLEKIDPVEAQAALLFLLAAAWEKRNAYDRALEFANQANATGRKFLSYDGKTQGNGIRLRPHRYW
ncbi:MAG: biotin/lipoyl-binding protein [Desulfobacterium sp.]|nr:biotin/lipoyl-binding protein [Desulfobacterium sp.]